MGASLEDHLSPVLGALSFPAERWAIVTAAESYGADLRTRTALRRLTQRVYFSREMLLREVAANGGAGRNPVETKTMSARVPPGTRRPRGHAVIPPSRHTGHAEGA